jgi:hypothetical protein
MFKVGMHLDLGVGGGGGQKSPKRVAEVAFFLSFYWAAIPVFKINPRLVSEAKTEV